MVIGTPASASILPEPSSSVNIAVPSMPPELEVTVANPVVTGISPTEMNLRLSLGPSVNAMTFALLTTLPDSSTQVELKCVPSDCKNVIVPAAGLPVALLRKIVVLQEPPVKAPTATCGK